jgi:hypothetical protein
MGGKEEAMMFEVECDDINLAKLVGKWIYNTEHGYYGRLANRLSYTEFKYLNMHFDRYGLGEPKDREEQVPEGDWHTMSVYDYVNFSHFYHTFDTLEELVDWLPAIGVKRRRPET